jgi:hypothetical protein
MFDNRVKTGVGKRDSTVVYNCALRIFHPPCPAWLRIVCLVGLDKRKVKEKEIST